MEEQQEVVTQEIVVGEIESQDIDSLKKQLAETRREAGSYRIKLKAIESEKNNSNDNLKIELAELKQQLKHEKIVSLATKLNFIDPELVTGIAETKDNFEDFLTDLASEKRWMLSQVESEKMQHEDEKVKPKISSTNPPERKNDSSGIIAESQLKNVKFLTENLAEIFQAYREGRIQTGI